MGKLLDKAKASERGDARRLTDDEIELVFAAIAGEITMKQFSAALGAKNTSATTRLAYSVLRGLRNKQFTLLITMPVKKQ